MGFGCLGECAGGVRLAPHLPSPSPRPSPAQRERGKSACGALCGKVCFSLDGRSAR